MFVGWYFILAVPLGIAADGCLGVGQGEADHGPEPQERDSSTSRFPGPMQERGGGPFGYAQSPAVRLYKVRLQTG